MNHERNNPEFTFTPRKVLVGALLALGLVACTTLVSRNDWREGYGPVVPHDTFPADCSVCHVSSDWQVLKEDFEYDHEAQTGVPLTGSHQDASCLLCHNDRGPVSVFAARGCAGCHEDTHRGTLGAACDDCHNEDTWHPVEAIAQHNRTRFPLVGAHAAAACFACHEGAETANFQGVDNACETCHVSDLARATSFDHVSQGITNDCQQCHIPTSWSTAQFAHPASFQLTGGHGGLDCSDCHGTGPITSLPTDCASCHLDDYQQTTDPNHALSGFSTDCTQCHNTNTWSGAIFDHFFPLTAGHGGLDCSDCHGTGAITSIPSDCVSCHLDDYQLTTDPNHALSGFSTDCAACHSTSTWLGATFDHLFPLSGPHGGLDCADCHTTPGTQSVFSCIDCHEHGQEEMADDHDEVPGYVWSSASCYQCHPQGRSR